MGLFEHFPYTNFHELNLTWFLDTFRELLTEWEEQKQEFADLKEAWEAMRTWITEYFDNLDVQEEINNKLDEMARSGALSILLEPYIPSLVTDWLNANIEPTSPPVDKTFTIEGAAADSEAVGFLQDILVRNTIGGYGLFDCNARHTGYILKLTGRSTPSDNWYYSDFLKADMDSIVFTCPTSDDNVVLSAVCAVAFYTSTDPDTYISAATVSVISGSAGGYRWFSANVPANAEYFRVSVFRSAAADYKFIKINRNGSIPWLIEQNGYYSDSVEFTSADTLYVSDIDVYAGNTYRIYPVTLPDPGEVINIFSNGSGGSAKFARITSNSKYVDLNVEVDGKLCVFNITSGGNAFTGTFSYKVLSGAALAYDCTPKVYYVGKSNRITDSFQEKVRDSASFTALLLKLKDDFREKIIYVEEGEYDIFSEYADLRSAGLLDPVPTSSSFDPSSSFEPYNVYIPYNTHIIGMGHVKLNYLPAAADTYENESKAISPINVAGSMTLENVEIYAKNCRYAIHDDPLQNGMYSGAIKKYLNVKAVKYANDDPDLGYRHCFGCGVPKAETYVFENCYFENQNSSGGSRNVYFHDRKTVDGSNMIPIMSSRIIMKNVISVAASTLAFFFGNIGAAMDIEVDMNECWTEGVIVSGDEGNWMTGNNTNSFRFRLLKSVYDRLVIRDTNNTLTPEIYD